MSVTPKQDKYCHELLPIDRDEKVLGLYRHHVFAYILPLLIAAFVIAILIGLTLLMTRSLGAGTEAIIAPKYQSFAYQITGFMSVLIIVFAYIPVYLRVQERLVLTNESIFQVLQPSLFSNKISQVGLDHIADVTIHQDLIGNLLGYGSITIETPGEQNNYVYQYLAHPRRAAREIIEAQEDFSAALQGGYLPTTMAANNTAAPQPITVDPAQYQQFLEYQKQQAENGQASKEQ